MRVYLSGSVSNCLDTYREKFKEAEDVLKGQGHIVINPACLPIGLSEVDYMPICLSMLEAADAICMIGDDWRHSRGAVLEKAYADYQGKKVIYYGNGKTIEG